MIDFLMKILAIDSTSGKEDSIADYIAKEWLPKNAEVEVHTIPNDKKNVFFKWGVPKIIFCSHLDTVAPYIPPAHDDEFIYGRGSCDAKGQIASLYAACCELQEEHQTNFGLLLLAGEEVGSYGAKFANNLISSCEYVIIGEPTENKLITAAKGTLLTEVSIKGKSCHSGYPHLGDNAIETMRLFLNRLAELKFPKDPILGDVTYNIGDLNSPNFHNVIPDSVKLKVFFRTTFVASNQVIAEKILSIANHKIAITFGDNSVPMKFYTVDGFATDIVAYGSDAPHLTNLGKRLLYGPGSILVAHTPEEKIKITELHQAKLAYKKLYYQLCQK